ncbi:inositol hexakisphosphate and diphosphoinositol-pentakisphosphate kinase, partial [Conglomerata obtusa]
MRIGFCIMEHKLTRPHVQKFIERFNKDLQVVVFDQNTILNEPVSNWPPTDFLISFYHTALPLSKVRNYLELHKIKCINNLFMQYSLFDRRVIYIILSAIGVTVTEHYFVNRDEVRVNENLREYLEKRFDINLKLEKNEIIEHNDYIQINNNILYKPFVEKPVNAENHDIYIYLKDGSVRKLFRKQQNKSSEVVWDIKGVRRDGSYIYEKFYDSEIEKDIKVYALGNETAYAETRKSPTIDGVVERDEKGKEKRDIIKLKESEYESARKITMAFDQFICGFDILRSNNKSYIIDVNGWSFVKNNRSYYDLCAELIKREIEKLNRTTKLEDVKYKKIIRVYRHGDRTPKQKYKLKVKDVENLIDREIYINKDFEEIIEVLRNSHDERFNKILEILEKRKNEKGTKLQIKLVKNNAEIICKWGGVLTHTGISQCKEIGEGLRYFIADVNPELLNNIKIFSSSEGRVFESAQNFINALSFNEVPVIKDKTLLDDTFHANELLENGRIYLKTAFDKFKTEEDEIYFLNIFNNLRTDDYKEGNEKEMQDIFIRWAKMKQKIIEDGSMIYNRVSEINDNLKYDLIHNNEKIKAIFNNERIVEFYLLIRKYYRFIIENEYGETKKEKIKTSQAISGVLLNKIFQDFKSDNGVNIYFTKESRMYTLFNILNFTNNQESTIKEFNYGSSFGFDIYEKDDVERIRIIFNRGVECQEIIDGCMDIRHRVPLRDNELLLDEEFNIFKANLQKLL